MSAGYFSPYSEVNCLYKLFLEIGNVFAYDFACAIAAFCSLVGEAASSLRYYFDLLCFALSSQSFVCLSALIFPYFYFSCFTLFILDFSFIVDACSI